MPSRSVFRRSASIVKPISRMVIGNALRFNTSMHPISLPTTPFITGYAIFGTTLSFTRRWSKACHVLMTPKTAPTSAIESVTPSLIPNVTNSFSAFPHAPVRQNQPTRLPTTLLVLRNWSVEALISSSTPSVTGGGIRGFRCDTSGYQVTLHKPTCAYS
jgi:hypothetical protein